MEIKQFEDTARRWEVVWLEAALPSTTVLDLGEQIKDFKPQTT